MLIVRAHQILGEAHVTAQAVVTHDPLGQAIKPVSVSLYAGLWDVTGSLCGEDLPLILGGWATAREQMIAEEFGGWHNLL